MTGPQTHKSPVGPFERISLFSNWHPSLSCGGDYDDGTGLMSRYNHAFKPISQHLHNAV